MSLNLYPEWKVFIDSKQKTASIRLGEKFWHIGAVMPLTIGRKSLSAKKIANIEITKIIFCRFSDLTDKLMQKDCSWKKATLRKILSKIYNQSIKNDNVVTVVEWKYI